MEATGAGFRCVHGGVRCSCLMQLAMRLRSSAMALNRKGAPLRRRFFFAKGKPLT
jgi:hypothetical protein